MKPVTVKIAGDASEADRLFVSTVPVVQVRLTVTLAVLPSLKSLLTVNVPVFSVLTKEQRAVHDARRRTAAAEALCQLGEAAQGAAVALARACGDESESVREWAGEALENVGPPATSDMADLAALAGDDKADVAYWAVTLLGRSSEYVDVALPALVDALTSHAAVAVRQRAAWALGRIGPAAAGALETLKRAATSEDPRLARLSKQAIERLGGRG